MSVYTRLAHRFNKYLDVKIVFLMDTLLSMLASLVTLFLIGYFGGEVYSEQEFVLLWILGAFAATLVSKIIFRSYKIVIRHTTFSDILRFSFETVAKDVLFLLIIIL